MTVPDAVKEDHPGHSHPIPAWLLIVVSICVVGLLASVVLVSVQSYQTNKRLSALEEYVQGRGEFRDEEVERQDEQFRVGICDVLSSLPEDQLLDTLRFKYHCGPGIPLRDLPEIYGDEDLTNVQIPEE